jgi:predicted nicotinamide N-methyase
MEISPLPFADTKYDGPEEVVTLRPAGRAIRLVRPADPDRLLDDPDVLERNRADDYMPYWAYLWPGAYLLAEAVAARDWAPGVRALEIGCGLGLAGLAGLAAGLNVRFTDYDAAPLRFVARSAAENGVGPDRFEAALLDWRRLPEERFDVILGADVLYERRLVPLVVHLIDRMLAPGGIALVAGPYRVATEDLPDWAGRHGLAIDSGAATARDERGAPVRGTVHRITRRG